MLPAGKHLRHQSHECEPSARNEARNTGEQALARSPATQSAAPSVWTMQIVSSSKNESVVHQASDSNRLPQQHEHRASILA